MQYTYNHQCMVTLTVGETTDQMEWHLPTYDPQNQNKYHYKLHSLDIYFWKQEDALQFVNGIRRVLPPAQVEVLDEPAQPSHHHSHHQADPVSAVVQQLEHAAISDPHYGSPQQSQQQAPVSFAGPPTSAVPAQQEPPASFAPMAYNPAAPAAPEAIRHREKTPPPEDGGVDPLAAAVAYDAQAPFSPGFVPPPGFQSAQVGATGLPPPAPAAAVRRATATRAPARRDHARTGRPRRPGLTGIGKPLRQQLSRHPGPAASSTSTPAADSAGPASATAPAATDPAADAASSDARRDGHAPGHEPRSYADRGVLAVLVHNAAAVAGSVGLLGAPAALPADGAGGGPVQGVHGQAGAGGQVGGERGAAREGRHRHVEEV